MSFAIKHRRIDRRNGLTDATLAVDIANAEDAGRIVERLAASYPRHGCYLPTVCWFCDAAGVHLIWAQSE